MHDTTHPGHLATRIHTTPVLADPAGLLVLPDHAVLVVSDLHFEKGSSFAPAGQLIPPYDTRSTLKRLAAGLDRHKPHTVIALGDSFHDRRADTRMHAGDAGTLAAMVKSVARWIWIEGNHDPAPPPQFGGAVHDVVELAGLVFRHEPTEGETPGEIAGHLHPCAKVRRNGRSLRARCFATDGTRLIMPAFGAYTGGLNVRDAAFARCFGRVPDALVMGRSKVWPVAGARCVGDG
ncbi:ligase-associated DNA damage response endonuclease PdeM [Maricaulis sp.]|uniref:ligase-associated DNA damage response endonuclease PdeM n=1 Tax=Maricaulis sp. TaxID=1486257 RepID=UPI002621D532|nr:ligase-associated DNA damage response endonuclease PdeM [Maricaulis sp.]